MLSNSKLPPAAHNIALAALSVIYSKPALALFEQHIKTIKTPKAIPAVVALAAVAVLQQLGPKGAQLPPAQMWGKQGVVHMLLAGLFEIAGTLGYKAGKPALKTAYQIVEEQIKKSGFGPGPRPQQGPPQGGPPGQPMPPQGPPGNMPPGAPQPGMGAPQPMMGGAMPPGMMQR